jgi:colanic acid/amylovoran biosynthesis glycosyltransferase
VPPDAGRVIYVTARLPYGTGEPFVIAEIAELRQQGCDVTVIPVRGEGEVSHSDARELIPITTAQPLLSWEILRAALGELIRSPSTVGRALLSLRGSRSPGVLLKNLSVVPKALWLAGYARRTGADHLHAHWASTPSTLAMLASDVSGIPWSFTAHRWDIAENNLLALKARRACFARAISEHGADELRGVVGDAGWAPWILHMGVPLPHRRKSSSPPEPPFRVLTAARLVEKKGHVHLVDAVRRLEKRGVSAFVDLVGDGPLGPSLRKHVRDIGLEQQVVFRGGVSHDELVREMGAGTWHVAVLPSVVTPAGELEGIPVFLIEALACGVPAIGTDSGGIPELLGDGAGLVVPPGDPEALAEALASLASDPARRDRLVERGRQRVEQEFSVEEVAAALLTRFRECGRPRLRS